MIARHLIIPAYLLLCLLLGGASLGGYASNLLLQLLAVPLIAWAFLTVRRTPMGQPARNLLSLTAAMVALVLIQLIPLPPGVWSALPGREPIAQGYRLLGEPLPWLPLTLDPGTARASLLWLLPALGVLLGIVRLGWFRAQWIGYVVVAATLAGLIVGTVQAADRDSPWYFYQVTNHGSAVGFFANANHMAILLVCCIPFAAALLLAGRRSERHSLQRRSGRYIAAAALALLITVGVVLNGSLAGLGLSLPAAALSAMMVLPRGSNWGRIAGLGALVTAAAALIGIVFAPIGDIFTTEAADSSLSRRAIFTVTAHAAGDFFPFGSGLSTFPEVYRTYDDPDTVDATWINHAHNDLLELALEFGLPGLLLIALFLVWWVARVKALWSRAEQADPIARAATIASGAILLHSLVDYPLRTAAVSALLAACLALMTQPVERQRRGQSRSSAAPARHLSAS